MDTLLKKHPDRIPLVVDKKKGDDIPDIENHKYLVPKDMTVSQFMVLIRKKIKIDSKKAVFLLINNTLPPNTATFGDLYLEHASPDKILYLTYAVENTFGSIEEHRELKDHQSVWYYQPR